jgi:catechol 2,3-dioxygenase
MNPNTLSPQLGHAHLYVRTLDRSIDFFTRVLGLSLTERIGDALAFLSSSAPHHTLALQALGESALPPAEGSVGLYHLAFELPSTAALEEALVRLDERGTRWQAVDHGISWAVYFDDPDGNGLELYIDRREHPDGRKEWGGMTTLLPRERIRRAAEADAVATDKS